MHDVLSRNVYVFKEHVGMFKAANNYDVFDPQTGELILECREDELGFLTKALRFTKFKRMTPFDVQIRTPSGEPVVRVCRDFSYIWSVVDVLDENDEPLGTFRQRLIWIGGTAFKVLDARGAHLCDLKGSFAAWNFRFVRDGIEFARVTKKWAGLGKELFTSADTYALEISEDVPPDSPLRRLILGAVICVDMVLKE
ncbi:MAG: RNAase [Planctomycetota bacterium]|nr:MAG: RNAase [Planctomycetota bacterium]